MRLNRSTPAVLLLCLLLGQAAALAHKLQHPLLDSPDSVDNACILCLSNQHLAGPATLATPPATPLHDTRYLPPASASASGPVACGYSSRAPPHQHHS